MRPLARPPRGRAGGRATLSLLALGLEPQAGQPRHRQLYAQVREAILSGRLAPGARLPSTRALAASLGVARNTALAAVEQLAAEGYVATRHGSGTYVSSTLPEAVLEARGATAPAAEPAAAERRTLPPPRRPGPWHPAFAHGLPDVSAFPSELWGRLVARSWRRPTAAMLLGRDPLGYRPLREAIAEYLRVVRAIACDADQVVITAGAQQGLDLAVRVLVQAGDTVWVEDPGYAGTQDALRGLGAVPVPVPVDGEGLSIAAGWARAPGARMAVVTPSHQFPLGVTMSLARRLALLDWAADGRWIVEDDYDSEYRYTGRPLAALQGLDRAGRVVYVGTFAKVLFPSLRVGYVVAPPALVEGFARVRAALDGYPAMGFQPALAEFLASGHFAQHVRRTRLLYAERRALLLGALERHLGGLAEAGPAAGGMHLVAALTAEGERRGTGTRETGTRGTGTGGGGAFDAAVAERVGRAGLLVAPLSTYYARRRAARQGFVLGYAAVPEERIDPAVAQLAAAVKGEG